LKVRGDTSYACVYYHHCSSLPRSQHRPLPDCPELDRPVKLNIAAATLDKIVQYWRDHEADPPVPHDLNYYEYVSHPKMTEAEVAFMDITDDMLFDLAEATNFLVCTPLMQLCALKFADIIKGLTSAQISTRFNIKQDMTPEELAKIMEQNRLIRLR